MEIKVVYFKRPVKFDVNRIIEKSYVITTEFEDFNKFYDLLGGDLSDAELRDYDFDGIDLTKYNIDGAIINSEILLSQGLYDGTYFSIVKKHIDDNSDETVVNKEIAISNEFRYLKPVDNNEVERDDANHIPFFYISDIHLAHQVLNKFIKMATKEEIYSYIKYLARKMIASIASIPYNSYLLIAGDTSSIFEFTTVFYNELIKMWRNPRKIIVVSGNHELLDPYEEIEENIEIYRKFFDNIGITFLQNDLLYVEGGTQFNILHENEILKKSEDEIRKLVQYSSVIILGGIGFTGLNEGYNASSKIRYGKSFDELPREDALQKDIDEANRFNAIYTKLLKSLYRNRVIVLTHSKKGDWNLQAHNPNWIYLNGHNHRNFYEVNDRRTIYADNQIGYRSKNIGLKYFYCDNHYDIFAYYPNGIHKITKKQYIDFNRGKFVSMSYNRDDGTIYMLKKDNRYMFIIYCKYSKKSQFKYLYLLNGGKLVRLERNSLEDLSYYYDNLEKYTENVNLLLNIYTGGQRRLSDFVKRIGGSGKIHGCIVDVERPNQLEGFSYCHLFVNPIDGKVTPYFAYDIQSRIVYKDFKTLLQANNCCELMANNYIMLEKESTNNLPVVQYSEQMVEWGDEDSVNDEGSYLYKISRIITSLQYCTDKNIVRLWKEELLNYDLITHIKQANQIDEIVDKRLMIDDKSI